MKERRMMISCKEHDNGEGYFLYLPFDGSLQDLSSNNRSIKISEGSASYPSGKNGNSITSSSTSNVVWISGPVDIYRDLLLGDLTIEFWFLIKKQTSFDIMVGYGGNIGMLYAAIRIQTGWNTGSLYIEYNTGDSHGNTFDVSNTGNLSVNQWNHYALVKEGNKISIYTNGTLRFSTTNVQVSQLGSDRNQMLIILNGDSLLDDFKISNYAKYTSDFIPS